MLRFVEVLHARARHRGCAKKADNPHYVTYYNLNVIVISDTYAVRAANDVIMASRVILLRR